MKRRNQEINIFSMSALDLFASAMGVFILITLILVPFFPNRGESQEFESVVTENEQLKAQIERLEIEVSGLEQDTSTTTDAELKERIRNLQNEVDNTTVLLGIRTTAKRFVFVVDMSGSIFRPGEQDYRQFIVLSVRNMVFSFEEAGLAMIGFHAPNGRFSQLHYWPPQLGYSPINRNTRHQIVSAVDQWMSRVEGGTPTREALLAALELEPEEIILLSDGAPSEPWRSVVSEVTRKNINRIPIHAVAVGDYVTQRDFIDFLVELTSLNGGELVGAKPG